jgi:acyl-CoA hydrolase
MTLIKKMKGRLQNMNWQQEYESKKMSAEDAVARFVKNGDRVSLGSGPLVESLCRVLADTVRAGKLNHISFDGSLILSNIHLNDTSLTSDKLRYQSYFLGDYGRAGVAAGSTTYVPLAYSNMRKYYEMNSLDVTFVHLTPPNEEGYCNMGCFSAGVMPLVLANTKTIIAGINPHMPWVAGDEETIHVSKIDAFVDNNLPLPEVPVERANEDDIKISNFILNEIPTEGACIQLGIGAMPNAIGYGLKNMRHVGIHTEMITGSMMELMVAGVVDNSQKKFMPGVSVASFTLGEQWQYDYVNKNKNVWFVSHHIGNNPYIIAQNDKVMSINGALAIDLQGSACAASIGFRPFSGAGGQIDYVRGATYSKGGKSFIALPSTFKDKSGATHSKIVLNLATGSQVTTSLSEIMYVVTEQGIVNLWGKDIPTRAKLLISIAHPDFREELTLQAKKQGLIY